MSHGGIHEVPGSAQAGGVPAVIRLIHVIAGLELGGAQITLYRLLSGLDRSTFECQVISLTDIGPMGERIRRLGVPVRALGMRPGVPNPRGLVILAHWFRRGRPDVIQTWMYHSDLIGGLAAKLAGRGRVVWGVHYGSLDRGSINRHTMWSARTCSWWSGWLPQRIVCASEASRRWHTGFGYPARKMVVIPNGFDMEQFHPDDEARFSVRGELSVSPDTPLVGLMARFDLQKDHRNFVQAAARVHASRPDVHFLLCGIGIHWDNQELAGWIDAAGLRQCFHLLGEREDMPHLTAALDIATLSSTAEGFGAVIAEAMACGVPCACTDVGDLAELVGETGKVVPPANPQALAEAMTELLALDREQRVRLGLAARRRVQERYPLSSVVLRYQSLYQELARSN
jgi:glycosyltransferase involved in cell wall biosynthesis